MSSPMFIANAHLDSLRSPECALLNELVERFEEAWLRGDRPAINDHLPADPRLRQLVESFGQDGRFVRRRLAPRDAPPNRGLTLRSRLHFLPDVAARRLPVFPLVGTLTQSNDREKPPQAVPIRCGELAGLVTGKKTAVDRLDHFFGMHFVGKAALGRQKSPGRILPGSRAPYRRASPSRRRRGCRANSNPRQQWRGLARTLSGTLAPATLWLDAAGLKQMVFYQHVAITPYRVVSAYRVKIDFLVFDCFSDFHSEFCHEIIELVFRPARRTLTINPLVPSFLVLQSGAKGSKHRVKESRRSFRSEGLARWIKIV